MSPPAGVCSKCYGLLHRGTGRCGVPVQALVPLVCPNDKQVEGHITAGNGARELARNSWEWANWAGKERAR